MKTSKDFLKAEEVNGSIYFKSKAGLTFLGANWVADQLDVSNDRVKFESVGTVLGNDLSLIQGYTVEGAKQFLKKLDKLLLKIQKENLPSERVAQENKKFIAEFNSPDRSTYKFAKVREDITDRGLVISYTGGELDPSVEYEYRWLSDDRFELKITGEWRRMDSIDFEFFNSEDECDGTGACEFGCICHAR